MTHFIPRLRDHLSSLMSRMRLPAAGAMSGLLLLGGLTAWYLQSESREAGPPVDGGDLLPVFEARLYALEERVRLEPAGSASRLELARLLHDGHRHQEAVVHLRVYLEGQPQDRQAWLDLANVLAAIERWEEAEEASVRLLERYPDDAAALYNLGAIAANLGRDEEARSWWSRLVERAADEPLAALAAESIARLEAMTAVGSPRSDLGVGPLPPGHPPIGSGSAGALPRKPEYLQSWHQARPGE